MKKSNYKYDQMTGERIPTPELVCEHYYTVGGKETIIKGDFTLILDGHEKTRSASEWKMIQEAVVKFNEMTGGREKILITNFVVDSSIEYWDE